MKEYISSRIIISLEFILIFCVFLVLGNSENTYTSSLVVLNDNINKNLDKNIITSSQDELFKEGLYNPLYSFTGDLTGYVGDCPLCTGYLACPPRTNVLKEGIYFNDKTYGTVRIVASSRKYPCGTIIEFSAASVSQDPVIAIILDRGVGGNDIDLLTDSTEDAIKNIGRKKLEFNVLREGWSHE